MMIDGSNVFVTGADGFIGSHVVERLVQSGASVTALAQYNSFDKSGWLDELNIDVLQQVKVVRGDIRDGEAMTNLAKGQDLILHLAALIGIPYSYESPRSYVDVNVIGTMNILEAARRAGVGRLVHTSTSEVYGTARYEPIDESHPLTGQSPYSASKIGADMLVESYARSFDLDALILRPFNTYGPRQSERAVIPTIIRQALDPNSDRIHIGATEPRRDFVFVEDTAGAFCALATSDNATCGKPYNAGTGVAVTIGEVLEAIQEVAGSQKPVIHDSSRRRPEKSEVMALIAESSSLEAVAGWKPQFDLHAGLERSVEWWRVRLAAGQVRKSTEFSV